jgi:hypothetical protein
VAKICLYESQDGLGFSIIVLVVLSLVLHSVGKVMQIVEGDLFLFFKNYFSSFVGVPIQKYL